MLQKIFQPSEIRENCICLTGQGSGGLIISFPTQRTKSGVKLRKLIHIRSPRILFKENKIWEKTMWPEIQLHIELMSWHQKFQMRKIAKRCSDAPFKISLSVSSSFSCKYIILCKKHLGGQVWVETIVAKIHPKLVPTRILYFKFFVNCMAELMYKNIYSSFFGKCFRQEHGVFVRVRKRFIFMQLSILKFVTWAYGSR